MGDSPSQYVLGEKYLNGDSVKSNFREAAKWFRKSANQGHALAQYNLGCLYLIGSGLKQNEKNALKWFKKGCSTRECRSTRTN